MIVLSAILCVISMTCKCYPVHVSVALADGNREREAGLPDATPSRLVHC
jgi:hypothetical protein